MNRYCRCILVFFLFSCLALSGCEKEDLMEYNVNLYNDDYNTDDSTYANPFIIVDYGYKHDKPTSKGMFNALKKAFMLAQVRWVPVGEVPSVYGSPYPAGEERTGVPYSLAQTSNTYIGLDVSLYTFLTALHNPRSVMYTRNLRLPPYNGFDCAPYYGAVCSSSVWYALGVPAPYYTRNIRAVPHLNKMDTLTATDVQLCDVLWSTGHVVMVFDIERDSSDSIVAVSIFETTRTNRLDGTIRRYEFKDFQNRWNQNNWILYRYNDFEHNTFIADDDFIISQGLLIPSFAYNNDICTERGDKVSYLEQDTILINILSDSYNTIELYRNDCLYVSRTIHSQNELFYNLPAGTYKARLSQGTQFSNFTSFEVINANVCVSVGSKVEVQFSSSNGVPEYVEFCDREDRPEKVYILTSEQIVRGSISVDYSYEFCKVHFRGKYGRVCLPKIKVNH